MKTILFPQPKSIPDSIKQNVMNYVSSDIRKKIPFLKRASLIRILIPNTLVFFVLIGIFSLVYNKASFSVSQPNILSHQINSSTKVFSPSSAHPSVISNQQDLETVLDQTDSLLEQLVWLWDEV